MLLADIEAGPGDPLPPFSSRRDHALEAMETFVLIPKELSLVLCEKESGTSSAMLPQHQAPSENVRKEASAAVWSNSRITRGTRFLPFQGTVRLDKLDVFGTLDRNDVSGTGSRSGFIHSRKLRGIPLPGIVSNNGAVLCSENVAVNFMFCLVGSAVGRGETGSGACRVMAARESVMPLRLSFSVGRILSGVWPLDHPVV